jgi:hypothetical protein
MQYRRSVQGRMLLTELETSARTESKRMINHNTPQLSRMGLPVHCATVPGLSRLNTRAVRISQYFMQSEGSLPCSQEPSTGPYPEPDQSNTYHPIRSQSSVVGIATSYGVDDRRFGVRVPVGTRIFSSPSRPDRLWGPPNLLPNGYRG